MSRLIILSALTLVGVSGFKPFQIIQCICGNITVGRVRNAHLVSSGSFVVQTISFCLEYVGSLSFAETSHFVLSSSVHMIYLGDEPLYSFLWLLLSPSSS